MPHRLIGSIDKQNIMSRVKELCRKHMETKRSYSIWKKIKKGVTNEVINELNFGRMYCSFPRGKASMGGKQV